MKFLAEDFFVRLPGEQTLLHINKHNISRLTMLKGDPAGLRGEYLFTCYGDCTNITGHLGRLKGDVSKLRGDISRVHGYCTGVDLDCTGLEGDVETLYRLRLEEEKFKKGGLFLSKHRFLTNEENERLWEVWVKIASCTIGMGEPEYLMIARPIKNRPPFPVDVWGRHYVADEDGSIVCFSINPADILLLRTNQEIQTCWSIYDKQNAKLRMRLLLARACTNPTVGVCFRIKQIDKFNIFKGLPFKYYKHQDGTFFQYNENGLLPFGYVRIDVGRWFKKVQDPIGPYVVGHDAPRAVGHDSQKRLMFYEKYIKDDFSLWKEHGCKLPEGCAHVLSNFEGVVFLDSNFNVLSVSGELDPGFVSKQIECLKRRIKSGVYDEKV